MAELHLIIGCMYSGKSTELLKVIQKYKILGEPVLAINHKLDERYGKNKIISHDKKESDCICIENLMDITSEEEYLRKIIIIEEAQFFQDLETFVNHALNDSKILYVAGLDGDYKMDAFGDILKLIPKCDSVKKLSALCMICKDGTLANFTKRIVENRENQTLVGSINTYIPVCRKHHSF